MTHKSYFSACYRHREIRYLAVESLIRSRRFYQSLLRLDVQDDSDGKGFRIRNQGNTRLIVVPATKRMPVQQLPGNADTGITILTRDFLYAYQYLKGVDVKFIGRIREHADGSWAVTLQDPDGYILELVETRPSRMLKTA
jgi:catechol-2,3-dioxygenase